MSGVLLTGATGLLGSYLLRDLLRSGRRVAVLVRPRRRQSPRQRIDAIVSHWERQTGETLARPTILCGDLTSDGATCDDDAVRWIAEHCPAVVHNAANMTFHGRDPRGEPWQTNVEGTRRILELCCRAGVRRFHYVSTAYVCGRREGRVRECELDVGQTPGNDYERSKVHAEQLVHSAAFLDPPTVYRPAILVGDSNSGYTRTFHGFYALVRLAHTLAGRIRFRATEAQRLIAALGLQGAERKNFVPVDWVSAQIAELLGRPECHGRTYHLTSSLPTPVKHMADAIQQAVESHSPLADASDATSRDGAWFESMFREQIGVYRAYWRDDPEFDATNTAWAAPHRPCPTVDQPMLVRMAEFAIGTNFGKRAAALNSSRRSCVHCDASRPGSACRSDC